MQWLRLHVTLICGKTKTHKRDGQGGGIADLRAFVVQVPKSVPNADVVFYITLRPNTGSLASAKHCEVDQDYRTLTG